MVRDDKSFRAPQQRVRHGWLTVAGVVYQRVSSRRGRQGGEIENITGQFREHCFGVDVTPPLLSEGISQFQRHRGNRIAGTGGDDDLVDSNHPAGPGSSRRRRSSSSTTTSER